MNNPKGFLDSLRNDLYQYPAIAPTMSWKDDIPPNPPANVSFGINAESNQLTWSLPEAAEDGDFPRRMVIYRSDTYPVDAANPSQIYAIISGDSTHYDVESDGDSYYAISALDRLHNESSIVQIAPSNIDFTQVPDSPVLLTNYPNPFNPSTTIRYGLLDYSEVSISIFDMSGRSVRKFNQSHTRSGELRWDGTNDSGQPVSAGIYLCRLEAKGVHANIKLVLLK